MDHSLHHAGSQVLKRTAMISFGLFCIKLIAYIPTGSLLMMTSLLDSLGDTISSAMNHYLHKISHEDPDREHPFGHGGFEVVGSLIQGMVILFFGISLALESVRKFIYDDSSHVDYEALPLAIAVLLVSGVAGFFLQAYLGRHIKKLQEEQGRSLTLVADHAHYAGDAVVNLVAALGVTAVYLTEALFLDALAGCAGAGFLLFTAYPILKKCVRDILHNQAPPELQQQIVDMVFAVDPRIKGIHYFRSRELGPHLFVDFHMQVDKNLSLIKAHEITHQVERCIKDAIPRADVIIHIDPDTVPEEAPWAPAYTLPEEK